MAIKYLLISNTFSTNKEKRTELINVTQNKLNSNSALQNVKNMLITKSDSFARETKQCLIKEVTAKLTKVGITNSLATERTEMNLRIPKLNVPSPVLLHCKKPYWLKALLLLQTELHQHKEFQYSWFYTQSQKVVCNWTNTYLLKTLWKQLLLRKSNLRQNSRLHMMFNIIPAINRYRSCNEKMYLSYSSEDKWNGIVILPRSPLSLPMISWT